MLPLGAKYADVFKSTGPPAKTSRLKEIKRHWRAIDKYYTSYEEFMRAAALSLTKQRDMITYNSLYERAINAKSIILKAMTELYEKKKYKSAALTKWWDTRKQVDSEIRTILKDNVPNFEWREDVFFFNRKLEKFKSRKEDGILLVKEDLTPLEESRTRLIKDGWLVEEESVRNEIKMRIKMFKEMSSVYALIMNHRLDDRAVEARKLLDQMVHKRLLGEDVSFLIDTIIKLTSDIVSVEKSVVYDGGGVGGRLVFSGTKGQVNTTSDLQPFLPHLDFINGTMSPTQRSIMKHQMITYNQEDIARVLSGIQIDQFLQSDIREDIGEWAGGGMEETIFNNFRGILCNCIKREVVLDGVSMVVLIATKNVEKEEGLFMDYSDTELYKMWTSHKERMTVFVEPPISKLDNMLASLSSDLSRLLMSEDSLENSRKQIDYRMRLEALKLLG
jgi:hypothetical protein